MDVVEEADVCAASRVNSSRIGVVDFGAGLLVAESGGEVVGSGGELDSMLRPWR